MASFRVLFFIFSAFLWGHACSAPAPRPIYTPVPGEIVRIKPSDTNGPQVGVGADFHHYYIALGSHPTDPNRQMVASITHHAVENGQLGPAQPLPTSGPGSIHGLEGDVLLTPTSVHVQHISATNRHQTQGIVGQQWIDGYHELQHRVQLIHQGRARARTANLEAADAHLKAHRIHNQAANHAEAGQHRAEHAAQAAHHLAQANRHNAIAEEQRHGVIRPLERHLTDARHSFRNAGISASTAADSRRHGEAALAHMVAASAHRSAHEAHHLTASMVTPAVHPSHFAHHTSQAQMHKNQMNAHHQSAAAHSPSQQHQAPNPTHSSVQAEDSRLRAAHSIIVAERVGRAPAPGQRRH